MDVSFPSVLLRFLLNCRILATPGVSIISDGTTIIVTGDVAAFSAAHTESTWFPTVGSLAFVWKTSKSDSTIFRLWCTPRDRSERFSYIHLFSSWFRHRISMDMVDMWGS